MRFSNKDCLSGNNIHSQNSDQPDNYEDCKDWCFNNSNCGGFIVKENTCFFKNTDCKNGLVESGGSTAFIPRNVKEIRFWCYIL